MKIRTPDEAKLGQVGRREVLKLGAASGVATAVATVAGPAVASTGSGSGSTAPGSCTGLQAIEAYPTSPLILEPFKDPVPVPKAYHPVDPAAVASWPSPPGPGVGQQDSDGGTHQLYPGTAGTVCEGMPAPIVYRIALRVAAHSFSSSPVRTLVDYVDRSGNKVPKGTVVPRLPDSTIYGFEGQFPGPMINAEYGKPCLIRFENHLDENPLNLDRGDFGSDEWKFLTHLHNGHTAAESDGNPHHKPEAYGPGAWVDNLYLNYPAGNDDCEKQSFLWFHDHTEGHTGANVYKGMAGLYPLYDPVLDPGDERRGLRLPGVRTEHADGTFDVEYDVPLAIHDLALDDGATPHQDFHNGCGETQPENWGRTFFRHFPNHGFVGDVFAVNGKAYPVLHVKRRKYRLRFLNASIARQYELVMMRSAAGPRSAVSLGYGGDELQGQWRLPDGEPCMRFVQIAASGGLLPSPLVRDTIETWPALRQEVVMDFTRYQDGSPTRKGDVLYLTNIAKMTDGRLLDNCTRTGLDPRYKIPILKIVIGDDAPDASLMPQPGQVLRPAPAMPDLAALPQRTFELQRGGFGGEVQWLINGHPFEPTVPIATVKQGRPEVWIVKNGGGGWSHPMHFHQEEHATLTRNGKPATGLYGHEDNCGKTDVVDLDASETVAIYRNFRTFTGKYVAHCHNLAHEDHSMMFGWIIEK